MNRLFNVDHYVFNPMFDYFYQVLYNTVLSIAESIYGLIMQLDLLCIEMAPTVENQANVSANTSIECKGLWLIASLVRLHRI